jgi:ABC-type lipoprotein export system ATPase subunit
VALARALINNPLLILCDEPTGNLDRASSDMVLSLLLYLHNKQQSILIVVTHNPDIAIKCSAQYRLADTVLHRVC